jgi:hypothetical protein
MKKTRNDIENASQIDIWIFPRRIEASRSSASSTTWQKGQQDINSANKGGKMQMGYSELKRKAPQ